jgi:hypothetical protein
MHPPKHESRVCKNSFRWLMQCQCVQEDVARASTVLRTFLL